MEEQLTIKKARNNRFWSGGIICRLFHHIRTIEELKFIDRVDGREVGQYECCRCNKKFMANSKSSWFRVYNQMRITLSIYEDGQKKNKIKNRVWKII